MMSFLQTKKLQVLSALMVFKNNKACHVSRPRDCLCSEVSNRHCLMFIDTVAGGGFVLEGREEEEICMHNPTVGAASKQEAVGEHTRRECIRR